MRRAGLLSLTVAAALLAGLSGCFTHDGANLSAAGLRQADGKAADAPAGKRLARARVSTKSGEILILEPDGSVTEVALDSPEGRDAFELTEAQLAELEVNLGLDLSAAGIPDLPAAATRRRGPTAQEKALADFAARTKPALPSFPKGFKADPQTFIGARVTAIKGDPKGELIEVTANLRPGVDADVAFAYATCALAGWAKDSGKSYARHIRTLQDKRNGKLLVGSVFTLSDRQPMGLRVMETSDTLRACKERGIPAARTEGAPKHG